MESVWLKRLHQPKSRDEAALRIYNEYSDQLARLIRSQLSSRLAARVDVSDIMQSVFRSFFERQYNVPDRDSLLALLIEITINKVRSKARFHLAEKRSVLREVGDSSTLSESAVSVQRITDPIRVRANGDAESSGAGSPQDKQAEAHAADDTEILIRRTFEILSAGATPEQAALACDLFESLPENLQPVMALRMEGLTETQIAKRMNLSRRTITRKLSLLREHLTNMR